LNLIGAQGVKIDLMEQPVCAARDPRLCAAVAFQSENQVVVNAGYRAADFSPVSMRAHA